MGLKQRSRFAMAACLLGANAPDIDVFAPLFLSVDGIMFHRGPTHSIFGWPVLAAGIVAILWLVDRVRPAGRKAVPFRPAALFLVALLAIVTHPFLDWLTTYAVTLFAPASWRWYSANAIFIVDWVYWLLMIAGVAWSALRRRRGRSRPGRPAQVAGAIMLAYIAANAAVSAWVEERTAAVLRARGIEPQLIVAGPPPLAFWERTISWRGAGRFGSGTFDFRNGVMIAPESAPLDLDNPKLARARQSSRYVRSFLTWSRMPIVVTIDGRTYLADQRFYGPIRSSSDPPSWREAARSHSFLVPLDSPPPR